MKKILVSHVFAIVDDDDFDRLNKFKWSIKTSKKEKVLYAKRFIIKDGKYTTQLMHREIMGAKKGEEVDHKDHDGLNNRKSNLRLCSFKENRRNRRQEKSSQEYIGVRKISYGYLARYYDDGKTVTVGVFGTAREAALARDKAVYTVRGDFAKLNFPF